MSALDRPTLDLAETTLEAGHKKLSALCNGERFNMSIPVDPNDTDIVIGNALYIGDKLLEENIALRAELAAVTAERDALREAQRWIPVGEKLPNYARNSNQEYSVFVETFDGKNYCDALFDYVDQSWYCGKLADDVSVTHWRPLPEPPNDQPQPEGG